MEGAMTIQQMLDTYQASRLPQVKNPQSIRYAVTILKAAFGSVKANRLTPEAIDAERARMKADTYAEGSIDRIFRSLRAAFNLAIRDRKLTWVPRIQMFNPEDARQGFVEPQEFALILEQLRGRDDAIADLWVFSYYSGRRPSELQGLRWIDISWPERTARIGRSKNRRPWFIVLEGPLMEVIQARKNIEPPCDYVFHRSGRPIDNSTRNRLFRTARKQAGFPTRLWYDVRRTCCRDMINAGIDATTTMATLGHSTRAMMDRYGIRSLDDQRRAISSLIEARQSWNRTICQTVLPLPR